MGEIARFAHFLIPLTSSLDSIGSRAFAAHKNGAHGGYAQAQ
jgi:hypothetical protein